VLFGLIKTSAIAEWLSSSAARFPTGKVAVIKEWLPNQSEPVGKEKYNV
jgi:hypothetical protein